MEQIIAKNINLVTVGEKIRIPKTSILLSSDPDPISPLSEFIKNIEYLGPVRQACPLSKFILREIAGVNGHTRTRTHRTGKKELEESCGGFRCARKSAPLLKGWLPVLSMPKRRPSRTNVVEWDA